MEEIFKDVPHYEGLYQVSNFGRVKSLQRLVKHNYGGLKTLKERLLRIGIDSCGYCVVVLCKNGYKETFKVHRIVAQCFLIPIKDKTHVNHKDGNKSNNSIDNIEWCNRSENVIHAIKTGLLKIKKGKEHCNYGSENKVSKKVIDTKSGRIFNTIREASETTKYTQKYISSMLRNERTNKTTLILYNEPNRSI